MSSNPREALLEILDDLYAWCRRRTGDELLGNDLAHETILSALPRLDTLHEPGRLRPWLFRIAQRRWADSCRHVVPEVSIGDADRWAAAEPPYDPELVKQVEKAMRRLPGKLRRPLRLHYLQGRPLREVAKRLRTSVNGVKARLYRARVILREEATR